jgi:ATP-binding cassette subfamily C protein
MNGARRADDRGFVAGVRRLLRIFTPKERRKLAFLAAGQVVGALLEVTAVALMVPLVALFANPDNISAYPRVAALAAALGLQEPGHLLLGACAFVFAFYALKDVYVVLLLSVQYRMVFAKQASLSSELLSQYVYSPWTVHLQRNSAELLRNILHQVELFIGSVLNPLLLIISEELVALAVIALLVFAQPLAAISALLIVGAAGFLVHSMIKGRIDEAGAAKQRYLGQMIQMVQQIFGGLKQARLLGREQYFVDTYSAAMSRFERVHRFLYIAGNLQRLTLELLLLGGFLLVTAVLVLKGDDLDALLPTLALFGVAIIRLLPSVNRAVIALARVRYHWPVVENLDRELTKLARYKHASEEGPAAGTGHVLTHAISVRGLSFRYPESDVDAITDVSLEIPKGSTVAITGPSGSGKTTLVDLVLGLMPPDSGAVFVDDVDIATCTRAWQRTIGCVPQDVYILDDSVRRNVAFGIPDAEIDDERVLAALEQAQVADVVARMRDGLDSRLGERGIRISGGQQQRIGIARALYAQPDVLVFDEATSAVDVETERQVSEAIERLGGEKTLIIIAHRESTIAKCDLRFRLDHGRLTAASAVHARSS